MGTLENMSPESTSSLFPDRPIRPLPKRRLRERLSPGVADSIKYPPAPQTSTPLFVYPYNSREGSSSSAELAGASGRENVVKPGEDVRFRRNGLTADRDDESLMSQARRALGSRGFHEPLEHGYRIPQRSGQPRHPKPQPPPSTASSADGYDSFENTNNKKKRKIPIAGETILNGTHVLSETNAFGIPSPPAMGDGDGGDPLPTSTPYYQSGGPLSNGQGISGPGRGRYGRIRNGRSPLRALSDSNTNWTGRNMKLRGANQYPSPPSENSGIISTAIASAEKLPAPTGQENISLLQQQASMKSSPTPSTQFTFTFGSQNPVSWPGSDPSPHNLTGSNRTHPANATEYHGGNARNTQTQSGLSPNISGSGNAQASLHPSSDNLGKGTPVATTAPKKSKRQGNSLLRAARQRRRDTEYQNMHHPPGPEDNYVCEFCEYELIFGHPPEALIRQYEIKDRRRRREEAERRRLLEKAKMKSRKGKKVNNSKMPAKNNTTSVDRASVSANDALIPPALPHRHDQEESEEIRSEAFDSEDNYDDHLSHEDETSALISDEASAQTISVARAGHSIRGAGGGPARVHA
ncbi:hypothetical protein F5Y19DRAFT_419332 [Xylariaceae sp. FL1651]|nr:hypothetical protein F5Y19DRAFT_419332 [Xylariaceae sp. FL1651]